MPDSIGKSELAAQVVDVLYGEMLSRPIKVKEDWPVEIKTQALNSQRLFRENHRKFSIELYEKHMTVEQLTELLRFHTSDIGKSIQEAQKLIQNDLSRKYRELEGSREKPKKPGPGLAMVRTIDYRMDDTDS